MWASQAEGKKEFGMGYTEVFRYMMEIRGIMAKVVIDR